MVIIFRRKYWRNI